MSVVAGACNKVRVKSQDFIRGVAQTTYKYSLQQQVAEGASEIDELNASAASDVVEVTVFDAAFNAAQSAKSHAWQYDVQGDGSEVRVKSQDFIRGVAQTTYKYILQQQVAEGASEIDELNASAASDVVEVTVFDAAFNAAQSAKSHAWQYDVQGDGSEVRVKSQDFIRGVAQTTYKYILQQQVAEGASEIDELNASAASDVVEVTVYDAAFNAAQTAKSHAWQYDVTGDGSEVRVKSQDFIRGVAQTTYKYILQQQVAEGASEIDELDASA